MLPDIKTRKLCIQAVNAYFDLDIMSDTSRCRTTQKARYVLYALAAKNTNYSSPELSDFFGVDHTTVLRALRHVDRTLLEECQQILDDCQSPDISKKEGQQIGTNPTVFFAACRSALNYSHIGGDWVIGAKKLWQRGGRRKEIGRRFEKSDQKIGQLIKQWRDECAE